MRPTTMLLDIIVRLVPGSSTHRHTNIEQQECSGRDDHGIPKEALDQSTTLTILVFSTPSLIFILTGQEQGSNISHSTSSIDDTMSRDGSSLARADFD
jgi:hypothetical protein